MKCFQLLTPFAKNLSAGIRKMRLRGTKITFMALIVQAMMIVLI